MNIFNISIDFTDDLELKVHGLNNHDYKYNVLIGRYKSPISGIGLKYSNNIDGIYGTIAIRKPHGFIHKFEKLSDETFERFKAIYRYKKEKYLEENYNYGHMTKEDIERFI